MPPEALQHILIKSIMKIRETDLYVIWKINCLHLILKEIRTSFLPEKPTYDVNLWVLGVRKWFKLVNSKVLFNPYGAGSESSISFFCVFISHFHFKNTCVVLLECLFVNVVLLECFLVAFHGNIFYQWKLMSFFFCISFDFYSKRFKLIYHNAIGFKFIHL